ncbi:hypothetical protein HYH03_017035 [Edaphochlamys debaryana]|uniref:TRP C-terminal domain-containing protein n=1 Tax=Edaphochlamys debaryana TaxID=47281 RepID=A0A835XIN9_9CHLO|nr:hypothetical protein HYH03_017035 [Edaphochlamys debaryana]|eukprot:KAG2484154.1 hypothetical protein HYH03_017035 [Edaphochlamys debaryana]
MAAATGAENYLAYSHACLLPNQDSEGQAFLQVLGALLTPCAVTAVCLLLWLLRYGFFRASKPSKPQRSRTSRAIRSAGSRLVSEESVQDVPVERMPNSIAAAPSVPGPPEGGLASAGSVFSSVSTKLGQYLHLHTMSAPFAHLSSGLSYVDESLTLGQQLGMVLMVAIFVLFPSWASAGFSVFSCMEVDGPQQTSTSQQYTALEFASVTHPRGYWTRDMQQECYTGVHIALYVPLGVVFLLIFCVSPPLVNFFLLWRIRDDLQYDTHTQRVYGFMYLRYKEQYFWWDSVLMAQTLALVAVDVFGRSLDVSYQALMLMLVLFLIAGVNSTVRPSRCRLLHNLEFWSSIVLSATIALNLYLVTGTEDLANQPAGNVIAALTLSINVIFIAIIACLIVCAWPRVRAALKRVRAYLPGGAGQGAGATADGSVPAERLSETGSTGAPNSIARPESQRYFSACLWRRRRPAAAHAKNDFARTDAVSAADVTRKQDFAEVLAGHITASDDVTTGAAPAYTGPVWPLASGGECPKQGFAEVLAGQTAASNVMTGASPAYTGPIWPLASGGECPKQDHEASAAGGGLSEPASSHLPQPSSSPVWAVVGAAAAGGSGGRPLTSGSGSLGSLGAVVALAVKPSGGLAGGPQAPQQEEEPQAPVLVQQLGTGDPAEPDGSRPALVSTEIVLEL